MPDAASNDNLLDIIDIVQGDTNLANMASQGGVTGFTPFGDALNPTPGPIRTMTRRRISGPTSLPSPMRWVSRRSRPSRAHDAAATATSVITDLQAFQTPPSPTSTRRRGGIFEARFDNELLGDTSTLGAEVAAMIKGLQTGNVALVQAAAEEMHANAANISSNDLPVTGGTYNTDGLTVADVLSTAGAPAAVAAATPAAAAPADAAPATPATAPAVAAAPAPVATTLAAADAGTHDLAPTAVEHHEPAIAEIHHFHHMWG